MSSLFPLCFLVVLPGVLLCCLVVVLHNSACFVIYLVAVFHQSSSFLHQDLLVAISLDFTCSFLVLSKFIALCWTMSMMFLVPTSPSYCKVSNGLLRSSNSVCVESIFCYLVFINVLFSQLYMSSFVLLFTMLWSLSVSTCK